jgi:hypothetical protein
MAKTPSKRFINWKDSTFTTDDTVPVIYNMTGVTSVDIDPQGEVKKFSGDGDLFPTTIAHTFSDPQITVQFADITAAHSLPPGLRGSFSSTHLDAKNGDSDDGGAYTVNLAHAMVNNTTTGGKHREFGEASVIISAESIDGVTNPLTYTAVSGT